MGRSRAVMEWDGAGVKAGGVMRTVWPRGITVLLCWIAIGLQDVCITAAAQDRASLAPESAMEAYRAVTAWVEAWETATTHALPNGTAGIWIGLRLNGRLEGEASDAHWARAGNPPATALPAAARLAMQRAADRLEGSALAVAASERGEGLESLDWKVELQLAWNLKRLEPAELPALAHAIRPGMDGLLIARGRETAWLFPGEMLARGQTVEQALLSLLARLDAPLVGLQEAMKTNSIHVWRFEAMHVAPVGPAGTARFLTRGSMVVSESAIDTGQLRAFADAMAGHLLTHRLPDTAGGMAGFLGGYSPEADWYEPVRASSQDRALAAYALARYAGTPGVASETAARARSLSIELVQGFEGVLPDPEVAALLKLAALENGEPLRDTLASADKALAMVWRPGEQFADSLSPGARAACAMAIGTPEAIDAAWSSVDPAGYPSLLPWLGWAELRQATDREARIGRLRGLRARLWETQIGPLAVPAEPDLVGGLRLAGRDGVDWHTARPLAFMATMMGDPAATPNEERASEILRVTRGLRFLRQLSVRETDKYRLPRPEAALGGIQAAPSRRRMPVAATAMSLLAVTEALRSLEAMR